MILGQGSYGKVFVRDGRAIKQFSKLSHLIQEYTALRYLEDSPHVVKALGVNFSTLELEMELFDTSLRKWLNRRVNVRASEAHQILRDILLGLVDLHDRNLAHGDLKPGNILIRENPLRAVLGDCGFVSVSKYAKVERTAALYRDPIIDHTCSHDIFSLGVCYLELIHGVKNSKQNSYHDLQHLVNSLPDFEHRSLICSMFQEEKQLRPTARVLLQRLYGESPPLWENRVFSYNTPLQTIPNQEIQAIKKLLKSLVQRYSVARGKRGFTALLHYLDNHRTRWTPLHVSLTVAISAYLFGSNSFREGDILWFGECREMNRLYQLLGQLLQDRIFVYLLLAP